MFISYNAKRWHNQDKDVLFHFTQMRYIKKLNNNQKREVTWINQFHFLLFANLVIQMDFEEPGLTSTEATLWYFHYSWSLTSQSLNVSRIYHVKEGNQHQTRSQKDLRLSRLRFLPCKMKIILFTLCLLHRLIVSIKQNHPHKAIKK